MSTLYQVKNGVCRGVCRRRRRSVDKLEFEQILKDTNIVGAETLSTYIRTKYFVLFALLPGLPLSLRAHVWMRVRVTVLLNEVIFLHCHCSMNISSL